MTTFSDIISAATQFAYTYNKIQNYSKFKEFEETKKSLKSTWQKWIKYRTYAQDLEKIKQIREKFGNDIADLLLKWTNKSKHQYSNYIAIDWSYKLEEKCEIFQWKCGEFFADHDYQQYLLARENYKKIWQQAISSLTPQVSTQKLRKWLTKQMPKPTNTEFTTENLNEAFAELHKTKQNIDLETLHTYNESKKAFKDFFKLRAPITTYNEQLADIEKNRTLMEDPITEKIKNWIANIRPLYKSEELMRSRLCSYISSTALYYGPTLETKYKLFLPIYIKYITNPSYQEYTQTKQKCKTIFAGLTVPLNELKCDLVIIKAEKWIHSGFVA